MILGRHRKLISLLILLLSWLLLLAGCRNSDHHADNQLQGHIALIIEPEDRAGEAMAARLSQTDAFKDLEVVAVKPGLAAEEQLRLLSEEGYLLIIASSPEYAMDVTIVAPDFPRTVYAIFGAVVEGDNVASIIPDFNASLTKAGALAVVAADYLPINEPQQELTRQEPTQQESAQQKPSQNEPTQQELTVAFISAVANPKREEWENAFKEGVTLADRSINIFSAAVGQENGRGSSQRYSLDQLLDEALQQNAYLICIDGNCLAKDQVTMSKKLSIQNAYLIGIEYDISAQFPEKVIASVVAFPEVILLPILENARHHKFYGGVFKPSDADGGVGLANLQGLPLDIEELLDDLHGTSNNQEDLPTVR
jgi:basic membrane lipoprotein Med (substrate-binding protein (PBP1-ABC) superfamily)